MKQTSLIMVNPVYFKGEWTWKFPNSITKSAPFYINNNTIVNVTMMSTRMSYLNYAKIDNMDAQCIELAYTVIIKSYNNLIYKFFFFHKKL